MSEFILELKELAFAYHKREVLRDINLQIAAGEAIGLQGPNGSGKTTLFRCVTGLEQIKSGAIIFAGKKISTKKDFQNLRREVGFSLQNAEDQLIFPTVAEDVCFGPLNLGLSQKEAEQRAGETLQSLGLVEYGQRLTHELSGGQQKLVALAGVLAMRPKLLLLDEPFNGLDQMASERVASLLASLDCAKILVSHDHKAVFRLCRRFYRLENGTLAEESGQTF